MLPEPYYQDESCTIYNADCRDILPHLDKVDLVLTDPPYGMSFQSNYRAQKHDKIKGDGALPIDLIETAIGKASCASHIFCRWDNLKDMPPPKSVIAWVKNNWSMGDLEHEYGRQWEACCFYPGPEHVFKKRPADVICAARTGNKRHPTEKPEAAIKQLLQHHDGDIVLDPFMGSGTTLVAAKQLGRKAIGIELEEKYCAIAVDRLRQGVLPF